MTRKHITEGDMLEVLPTLPEASFDCCVTDPPYELAFMGKKWDASGVSFRKETWEQVYRVLKPGAYMLAFGGTRTFHRIACGIEDAGFDIRDTLMWLFATGFPKSAGCLKPSYEPVILARKPGTKVLPLGIDECRVPVGTRPNIVSNPKAGSYSGVFREGSTADGETSLGRYPANVIHDGSDEVLEAFARYGSNSSSSRVGRRSGKEPGRFGAFDGQDDVLMGHDDFGTVARFFYCAKASSWERDFGCEHMKSQANRVNAPRECEEANFASSHGNHHPTVKPLELMRWLVRLVCPKDGVLLDPFGGSGTTGMACVAERRKFKLIEMEPKHCDIAEARITREFKRKRAQTLFDE